MKWSIRSNGSAFGTPKQNANKRRQPQQARATAMIAEPLEERRMMAAQLSAHAMLNKFASSPTAPPQLPRPAVVMPVGPTGGVLENDDRVTNASKVGIEFTKDGNISFGMDVDLFKFTAKKGDRIGFDIDRPSGSQLDSVLRLFNASGREIAYSDDDAGDGEAESLESFIGHQFVNAGTYYIGVSGAGNDAYSVISGFGDVNGATGKYTLKARRLPPPDTNDQISEAERAVLGEFITGRISDRKDVDFFAVTVEEGQTIVFDVELLDADGPVDSLLRLFDAEGNELAVSDDDYAPDDEDNFFGESFIEYTFEAAGTYFIAVSGSGNNAYDALTGLGDKNGQTGRYGLRIGDASIFHF